MCSQFDSEIAVSEVYRLFEEWVKQLVRIEIGQPAIDFIPQNVLIDDKGIIVAKNLKPAELEQFLEKVYRY